jgi:hypothetical protein
VSGTALTANSLLICTYDHTPARPKQRGEQVMAGQVLAAPGA